MAICVGSTGESKAIDEVIRLEKLRTDWRRIRLFVTVRHENVSENGDLCWPDELRESVVRRVACDFDRLARWFELD